MMRVWGLYYKLLDFPKSRWTGPCGVFCVSFKTQQNTDIVSGRPFFFRTRKLARLEAEKLTGNRVTYKVESFELTWKKN